MLLQKAHFSGILSNENVKLCARRFNIGVRKIDLPESSKHLVTRVAFSAGFNLVHSTGFLQCRQTVQLQGSTASHRRRVLQSRPVVFVMQHRAGVN